MKSFKSLREEALEKVKTAKVFDSKKSAENEKGKAFEKKGKVATKDEGDLEYGADNNKVHVTEALTSVGRKYEELYDTHYQKKFKEGRKQGMSPEDADKHAHKSLDDYKEQIRTGKIDPIGDMKEDIDQEYSDWQDSVKKKNPEHADKIKFKSNPDQRHVISAEHGDRSFGTFNMKTGESEHLGEAFIAPSLSAANAAAEYARQPKKSHLELAVKHLGGVSDHKSIKAHLASKGVNADLGTNDGYKTAYLTNLSHSPSEFRHKLGIKEEVKLGEQAIRFVNGADPHGHLFGVGAVRHDLSNIKTKKQELPRDRPIADIDPDWEKEQAEKRKKQGVKEEVKLGEARSLEDKIKVAKEIYAEKLKSATSPADRAQAKEDHENLIKKLSESESLYEVSKTTLVSYIKKAARSAAEAGNVAGFKAGRKQPKYNVSDETPTEIKRHKGIALAARKLAEAITMKGSIDQDAVKSHLEKISKKHGCSVDYLEKQLLKGKKVEQEHTDDMDVATKVALDHLAEKPDYYEKLEKVEGK